MTRTSIGESLHRTGTRRLLTAIVGCGIVALDLTLVSVAPRFSGADVRLALVLLAWVLFAAIARFDTRSLWLEPRPLQGWWYWVRVTAFIALFFGIFLVVAFATLHLTGVELPVHKLAPASLLPALRSACVEAPIIEEGIYRFALCTGTLAFLSRPSAIVVNGFVFGLLHVLYGNPSPENLFAGFLLAWAYMKSGTLLVPIAWHSLGNLVAVGSQLAAWYLVR